MVDASDQVPLVKLLSTPPELLAATAVRRSFACWTLRLPTPATAKRRNAILAGEERPAIEVAVPNTVVAFEAST